MVYVIPVWDKSSIQNVVFDVHIYPENSPSVVEEGMKRYIVEQFRRKRYG